MWTGSYITVIITIIDLCVYLIIYYYSESNQRKLDTEMQKLERVVITISSTVESAPMNMTNSILSIKVIASSMSQVILMQMKMANGCDIQLRILQI